MKRFLNFLKSHAQRWMRLARCAGYLPPCKHDFVEVYEGFRCKKCNEWLPDDYFGPDAEEPYCFHCGKVLEDFSDLGCGRCDARHPDFVIIGKADNHRL